MENQETTELEPKLYFNAIQNVLKLHGLEAEKWLDNKIYHQGY